MICGNFLTLKYEIVYMHSLAEKAIGSARGGSSLRHIKKVNSNVILTLLTVSFEIKKNRYKLSLCR